MTTIKIEMTEQDVQEALAEYISRQDAWSWADINPFDIELEVGKVYHDRQPDHDGDPVFKKAIITIKSE